MPICKRLAQRDILFDGPTAYGWGLALAVEPNDQGYMGPGSMVVVQAKHKRHIDDLRKRYHHLRLSQYPLSLYSIRLIPVLGAWSIEGYCLKEDDISPREFFKAHVISVKPSLQRFSTQTFQSLFKAMEHPFQIPIGQAQRVAYHSKGPGHRHPLLPLHSQQKKAVLDPIYEALRMRCSEALGTRTLYVTYPFNDQPLHLSLRYKGPATLDDQDILKTLADYLPKTSARRWRLRLRRTSLGYRYQKIAGIALYMLSSTLAPASQHERLEWYRNQT